jgi:hypothetical protein
MAARPSAARSTDDGQAREYRGQKGCDRQAWARTRAFPATAAPAGTSCGIPPEDETVDREPMRTRGRERLS